MSEDLNDEIEAIRSIYGDQILRKVDSEIYILSTPQSQSSQPKPSVRIRFPPDYPRSSPQVIGTETAGETAKKGHGKQIVEIVRTKLQEVFTSGSVCLFDVLQELEASSTNSTEDQESAASDNAGSDDDSLQTVNTLQISEPHIPEWATSAPITEKKSTFLARACYVKSPQQAKDFIAYLLDTDKRAAKATHNITAYRIRSRATTGPAAEVTYQDCDDDGEAAAGGRLLHLLQLMDVWDVLVIVSRWYGGVKLGPDRFSVINNVARDAVIRRGLTTQRVAKT
ncbi:hypothetical protein ACLMJK_001232 [Lecanora helva]